MTLYDIMDRCQYNQVFHVYVTNVYDQNIEIGHGPRSVIVNEELTEEGYDHLMDQVDYWSVAPDGSVVVLLRDEHFEERAETLYAKEYIAKWDNLRPETRPWKHSCELEDRT